MRCWREKRRQESRKESTPAPVSVIIPCYNAAATIGRAVASVAAQSRLPAEVIIVDDGSDEATRQVLAGLQEQYGRNWLKILFQPANRGPAAARNRAWKEAGQPLLAFLDADDAWHSEKIALQADFLCRHPEFAFCGHVSVVDPARLPDQLRSDFRVCEESLSRLLWKNRFRTPTVMLRAGLAGRFPETQRFGEDYRLWLELLSAGHRAAFIDLPLAVTYKPPFGARGLSRQLWAMEQGELKALAAVRPVIGRRRWAVAAAWSGLKFARRLLYTVAGRIRDRASSAKVFSRSGRLPAGERPSPPTVIFLVTDDWFFLLHRKALAEAARQAGFRVVVATAPGDRGDEIEAAGFEHRFVDLYRESRNPFREFLAIVGIYRLYRELRPDLVHQVAIKPILYGTLAARLAGVGAVVNAVTGLGHIFAGGGRRRRLLKKLVEQAYQRIGRRPGIVFLFENPDDREHFISRRLLSPEQAVLILGSGVDIKRFRPRAPAPRKSGAAPVVLLAARLLWSKGVGEYVKAARQLRAQGVAAEFQLAGRPDPGNPAAVPLACLLSWHRQRVIRWLGFCDDMPALYRQADIVCLPTRYREGIPVTLLEAAACGKPLVATAMPGCREIVIPGENGFLVSPGSVTELAAALEKLLSEERLRRDFGKAGRRLVEAHFSQEKVIAETFAVYRRLLEERWPKKRMEKV
jgi:glycosyltransferase involved in cell wall biosynthesis